MEQLGLKLQNLNTARTGNCGFGTVTSALLVVEINIDTANTEVWNGTAWTEGDDYRN